jgi:hypothetical protein
VVGENHQVKMGLGPQLLGAVLVADEGHDLGALGDLGNGLLDLPPGVADGLAGDPLIQKDGQGPKALVFGQLPQEDADQLIAGVVAVVGVRAVPAAAAGDADPRP